VQPFQLQVNANGAPETSARVPLEQLPGLRRVGENEILLHSEPIQGVFESYSDRCWKDWEYRRWVEEGLNGEIKDQFEAVK
jgi:hypothetical protein